MSYRINVLFAQFLGLLSLVFATSANAAVTGPYTADANTLHLWHLNDTTLSIQDTPTVATPINLQSLGAGSTSQLGQPAYPGFGTSVSTVATNGTGIYAKSRANGTADDTSMASFRNASTGAFTYEALVKFNNLTAAQANVYFEIISADGDEIGGFGDRTFQFDLAASPGGGYRLEFENIPGETGVTLHSNNVDVSLGTWYHAAVTYNGAQNTADNLKFYWTEVNPTFTEATLAGSVKMTNDLPGLFGDFAIGAEARNLRSNSGQWNGAVDEVRISDIARGADQFIFTVPEPSVYAVFSFIVGFGLIKYGGLSRRTKS